MNRGPETGPPAITTSGLTHRFGSLTAVDGASFAVESRIIFGLLGPNGAGKTTLIKMLTTLLPPTAGTASVAGIDIVAHPRAVRSHIGYVSQRQSADGELTGYENLLISAKLYGVPASQRRRRIDEALEFMNLGDSAHRLVGQYSGGMVRRIEMAQSMLHRPAVLILDEPTVGLDPVSRHALWRHIRGLRGEFGTTIFLTTHDMEEANGLCDIVAFMNRGRLTALGPPMELRAALGEDATLEDVFIWQTGTAVPERENGKDVARIQNAAGKPE
jgi:ABC-2 type transport system ATP-binding protein